MRLALLSVLLLSACSRKEEPEATGGEPPRSGSAANRALARASGEGELSAQANEALVLQQCNLACGARPGIDASACTRACAARCQAEPDVARIDVCASTLAAEAPPL